MRFFVKEDAVQISTNDPTSREIRSVHEELRSITAQLEELAPEWIDQLKNDPGSFRTLETEIHDAFLIRNGILAAVVLVAAAASRDFIQKVDSLPENHSTPLAKPRKLTIMIRFFYGVDFNPSSTAEAQNENS